MLFLVWKNWDVLCQRCLWHFLILVTLKSMQIILGFFILTDIVGIIAILLPWFTSLLYSGFIRSFFQPITLWWCQVIYGKINISNKNSFVPVTAIVFKLYWQNICTCLLILLAFVNLWDGEEKYFGYWVLGERCTIKKLESNIVSAVV